jgi:redox-sensitive bicupin YhaK (pirin superfamily)
MIYAEINLAGGRRYRVPSDQVERALYVLDGTIAIGNETFGPSEMVILKPGAEVVPAADAPARMVLIGGEPFPEKRYIYWNLVSSRPERIEQAKRDWRAGAFDGVPGEHEFIPLPDDPPPVRYP